jgi:hypothetical protein
MVPVVGAQVVAIHSPATGCTSGETFSIGQTDMNGQILFALPYGTWEITVDAVPADSVTRTPTDPAGPQDLVVTR